MPQDGTVPDDNNWGPIKLSFSGVPEIESTWVGDHLQELTVVDVRESYELNNPDQIDSKQTINDSIHIPLHELRDRTGEVPNDKPVVCVCHSGSRSSMAVNILKKAGYENVANLKGGMLAWVNG
jgi:rhodanese-related sulfurtransferase